MNTNTDIDRLPKSRRDWLQIFGNQWGTRKHEAGHLTPEENQRLLEALNPFRREIASAGEHGSRPQSGDSARPGPQFR